MAIVLKDKVVVITGASGGIGREAAVLFAKEGALCVLAARRKELLAELRGRLAGGPQKHLAMATDIAKEEDVKRLIEEAYKRYGRIDILVNNAAVSYVGRVKDMDIEKAGTAININLLGTIRITRHVLPFMIDRRAGHIINISSIIGKRGVPYRSVYCASKFGMEGFMESLRAEVMKYGIKVSIIRPPSVRTDFSKKIQRDSDVDHHALDDMGPGTVARMIADVAKRPKRDINMGIFAKGFLFLNGVLPGLMDKIVREK
ncbi:MAG: SDR family NAD(P)-dependent oxidoreductase [Candidatus Omnitrophica bacterium]|nr:SDR family NAD(P)-dependent oxidoreductase [Candidatus Omnitrophota bacterium]